MRIIEYKSNIQLWNTDNGGSIHSVHAYRCISDSNLSIRKQGFKKYKIYLTVHLNRKE